jgi:hypothetical protein
MLAGFVSRFVYEVSSSVRSALNSGKGFPVALRMEANDTARRFTTCILNRYSVETIIYRTKFIFKFSNFSGNSALGVKTTGF